MLPILLGFGLLVTGCTPPVSTHRAPEASPRKHRPKHSSALPVARVQPPENTLNRAELDRVLEEGIGRFLQRVRVAPARDQSGRFVGYQIQELFPGETRRITCPRPGDVLQTVNGTPITRPDELYGVWQTLRSIDRVDILVMRAGTPTTCSYHVIGERAEHPAVESDESPASP